MCDSKQRLACRWGVVYPIEDATDDCVSIAAGLQMRLFLHSCFYFVSASASGALGIDVGSANSVVAVTRRGGVDVVANEATKRQTPSVIAFDERRRFMGESASALRSSRPRGCVVGIKALLGCDDSEAGSDQVDYLGSKRAFSPVQIFAMLLHHLHLTAEREHGSALPECALAVPAHWGAAQRQAVLDAAEVAGTRCVRLISDVSARPPRPPTARVHRAPSATTARVPRPPLCMASSTTNLARCSGCRCCAGLRAGASRRVAHRRGPLCGLRGRRCLWRAVLRRSHATGRTASALARPRG